MYLSLGFYIISSYLSINHSLSLHVIAGSQCSKYLVQANLPRIGMEYDYSKNHVSHFEITNYTMRNVLHTW